MAELIIIGAGGHAEAVADSAMREHKIIGFIDDYKHGSHLGLPIFEGGLEAIENPMKYLYFIALGEMAPRLRWYEKLTKAGLLIPNIIDPTAVVSPTAEIGHANYVGKLAVLEANSHIGDNNLINSKSLIEHGCYVGNHCNISTNAVINGDCRMGDYVFYGSCAVCNCEISIGDGATVGSGSTVIRNVAPGSTVVGCPAREIRKGEEV